MSNSYLCGSLWIERRDELVFIFNATDFKVPKTRLIKYPLEIIIVDFLTIISHGNDRV